MYNKKHMIGIYKITSPTGKIYIGQSVNFESRKYQYKSSWKNKSQKHLGPKLYNSLQKHGYENHTFEMIEECLVEQLNEKETHWKQYYLNLIGWKNVLFCELFDNGGGPKSEDTKQKISISNKGKITSDETKIRMSITHKGRIRSQETKDKISKSNKGKKKSKIHIENMLKNRDNLIKGVILANSKPILQYDLEGNFIKEWDSITNAKKHLGKGDIMGCLLNKQKTAGGFIWKYKEINSRF
jgi:group I intron endonuclease